MRYLFLAWAVIWGLVLEQNIYFQEGFAGYPPGTIPPEWYLGDGGTQDLVPPLDPDSTWAIVLEHNGHTLGSGAFLLIRDDVGWINARKQRDTIVTDTFSVTGLGPYRLYLSYLTYHKLYGYVNRDTGYVQVYDGTQWQTVRKYAKGQVVGGWDSLAYQELIDITPYANSQMRIRFIWDVNSGQVWAIDSIRVFSACLAPFSLYLSWRDTDSLYIRWSAMPVDSVVIEVGPSGFAVGSGLRLVFHNPLTDTDTVVYVLPGSYEVYAWSYCGPYASMDTASALLCGPPLLLPWSENFTEPNFWHTTCWQRNNAQYIYIDTALACAPDSIAMRIRSKKGVALTSPEFLVPSGSGVIVSYRYRPGGKGCGSKPGILDRLAIQYRNDRQWQTLYVHRGHKEKTCLEACAAVDLYSP